MTSVTFARGGGGVKAGKGGGIGSAIAGAVQAVTGGTPMNGTVNGKRGFQPGNTFGANRKGKGATPAQAASGKHRSAQSVVRKHIKAGTLASKAGRQSVRDAAHASRNLQSARAEAVAARSADSKASRAVASDRASALPKPGEPPVSAPYKAPTGVAKATQDRVASSMTEASKYKADHAARNLADLHDRAGKGDLKAMDVHQHVERIGRGATKDELFAAAKTAGVEHSATTKKALLDHLKNHAHGLGEKARTAAATPKDIPSKDFADRVTRAAHEAPTGGFGEEKTMISHVKAHLDRTDPAFARMNPEQFKAKLVEAHRAGHMELGRGDLFDGMNRHDVAASSTKHLNAEYHFVRHAPATKEQSRPDYQAQLKAKARAYVRGTQP
jgi:hypothetical protein